MEKMNICTESRDNLRKTAKAKEAGDEEEVERLREERYSYQRKDEGKQKESGAAKIGAGLLFGAVLGGAAVYALTKVMNNDDNENDKKRQQQRY